MKLPDGRKTGSDSDRIRAPNCAV